MGEQPSPIDILQLLWGILQKAELYFSDGISELKALHRKSFEIIKLLTILCLSAQKIKTTWFMLLSLIISGAGVISSTTSIETTVGISSSIEATTGISPTGGHSKKQNVTEDIQYWLFFIYLSSLAEKQFARAFSMRTGNRVA